MVKVHHDIVCALDKNCCAVLVMLDLSAAFDVIDHNILFKRMENMFGISGSALKWVTSYLGERHQRVAVGSSFSDACRLEFGVPQGSVLGPRLYCLFSKPLGEVCRRHEMAYHIYADDTQIYIVVEPSNSWTNMSQRLSNCLSDIRMWMSGNLLKLNEEKTELIVFAPKHRLKDMRSFELAFGDCIVSDAFLSRIWAYSLTSL